MIWFYELCYVQDRSKLFKIDQEIKMSEIIDNEIFQNISLFKKEKNKKIKELEKIQIKFFCQLSVISHSILTSHKKIKIIII